MALAIFLATGVTMQAQDRLTQYKVRNAISVRTPIMNDSINPKGEKHTKKMLLQTPVVLHLPDAPMQSLTADTAGYLSFEKADKDNKLYLVKTQIRAERFLKGKLKITSPVRWEVFIDGASKQVKDAAEDSITSGSSRDIALSLEPERDYEIIIKLLSASDDKSGSNAEMRTDQRREIQGYRLQSRSGSKEAFFSRQYSLWQPCHLCFHLSQRKVSADPLLG